MTARGGAARRVWPPVSVVMPVRDEPEAVVEALASALAQDYRGPLEVVVADGSLRPETGRAVRSAFATVRLVVNPERGTAAGLNRAVAAASGDLLLRCDAHCTLPPGYARTAVETLARTGADAVGGMQRAVGATPFSRAVALAMTTPWGAGDARYRIGGAEGPVDTVYLGVYRREALEAAGGFDETLERNQDYALNWRLRQRGGTVWFTPALSARYRPRGSLGALARQYYGYGWWKRIMLRRHPGSLRWRHLAAPALIAWLAVSAAAAGFGSAAGAAAALAYPAGLAVVAAFEGARRRDPAAVLLPAALAAMHLAWGAGFWSAWVARRS